MPPLSQCIDLFLICEENFPLEEAFNGDDFLKKSKLHTSLVVKI